MTALAIDNPNRTRVKAIWHFSLQCQCPQCDFEFDALGRMSAGTTHVVPGQNLGQITARCPACQHVFDAVTQW